MPNMNGKAPIPRPRAPGADWPEIRTIADLAKVAKNWFDNPTHLEWDEIYYVMDGIRRVVEPVHTDRKRHHAYIEADFESMRRGGSSRTAKCLCGWEGPERGTLELAADDALIHEQSEFGVVHG